MKRFLMVSLVLIVALTIGFAGVQAQDNNPLVIVMDGELYQWFGDGNQGVIRYHACTPDERIVS